MGNIKNEWFGRWFESPYYHILYKNRDEQEAKCFIDSLVAFLSFKPGQKILDLGCGKGRHAIYLHKLGYEVVGVDLSTYNIGFAKRFSKIFGDDKLRFYIHDMRHELEEKDFDFVLNMFTSFGYFEDPEENQKAINYASKGLIPNGKLVVDFFNTHKVLDKLVPTEQKTIANIEFLITKKVENGFIVKDIQFEDKGVNYHFTEKVKAIFEDEFKGYFKKAGLHLENCFGDYNLNDFDKKHSDRMIFILGKK